MPWFILGFLALAGVRSAGLIPAAALGPISSVATVLTVLSMAALELPTNEAVRAAVKAGAGAGSGTRSASVVAGSIEAGLLHQAGITLPDRDFRVLRHAERYRSRAAEALMAVVTGRTL